MPHSFNVLTALSLAALVTAVPPSFGNKPALGKRDFGNFQLWTENQSWDWQFTQTMTYTEGSTEYGFTVSTTESQPTTELSAVPSDSPTSASESSTEQPSSPATSDQQGYLDAHNSFRSQHGASDLVWSDTLASAAQQWADRCQFVHSGGTVGPYGENLASGTGDFPVSEAIKLWTDEVAQYDPGNPVPSHFTQVVWKGTTELGCAHALCNNLIPGAGQAHFYVCEYSPSGNVIGQFGENVQV